MDNAILTEHKLRNGLHTLLLIGGMALILALSASFLFGGGVGVWVAGLVALMLFLAPRMSPAMVLGLYRAHPLSPGEAPDLYAVVAELARRAGLPRMPALYYLPSTVMNAFTMGSREDAAMVVTDGLLRRLSLRELVGVLAHETSHVRNNDVRVMGLADVVGRLTRILSLMGQLLILVSLPMMLFTPGDIPWAGFLLLVFAPSLSALLQLALSRTREFDADLDAARLTGDPAGLASALAKLERYQGGLLERILLPGRRNPNPSLLRTHPETKERIDRLMALKPGPLEAQVYPRRLEDGLGDLITGPYAVVTRRPSHHRLFGLWY